MTLKTIFVHWQGLRGQRKNTGDSPDRLSFSPEIARSCLLCSLRILRVKCQNGSQRTHPAHSLSPNRKPGGSGFWPAALSFVSLLGQLPPGSHRAVASFANEVIVGWKLWWSRGSRVHSDLPESSSVSFLPSSLYCPEGPAAIFESCRPGNFQRDFGALVNIFKLPKVREDSRAVIVQSGLESNGCSSGAAMWTCWSRQCCGHTVVPHSASWWLWPDPEILYPGYFRAAAGRILDKLEQIILCHGELSCAMCNV